MSWVSGCVATWPRRWPARPPTSPTPCPRGSMPGEQAGRPGALHTLRTLMARMILMDEFHLGVFARHALSAPEQDALRRLLNDPTFQADLIRAVRRIFRRHP